MEGWSIDRFIKPMEDFICSVCREVTRDAMSTNCGHIFCSYCISRSSSQSRKCPTCREIVTIVVPNFSLRTTIMKSHVTCLYKEYGCTTIQSLSEINLHQQQCSYYHKPCTLCKELVRVTEQTIHDTTQCTYRFEPCPTGCGTSIQVLHQETHYRETCPETIITCLYCEWKGKRSEKHNEHCEEYRIDCMYKPYGCSVQCKRKEMSHHESENHTNIVCRAIDRTRIEFQEYQASQLQEGPFKIQGHVHRVLLCSDMEKESCSFCNVEIEPLRDTYFAYRCGKGCPVTICIGCLGKRRLYKSKHMLQYPSMLFL